MHACNAVGPRFGKREPVATLDSGTRLPPVRKHLRCIDGRCAMNLGLEGRRVLVTGASRGIGRAIAEAFAAEGAHVALTYLKDAAGAEDTARRCSPAQIVRLRLDLASEASIDSAVHDLLSQWQGVDVVVNNAVAWPGFPEPGELFE